MIPTNVCPAPIPASPPNELTSSHLTPNQFHTLIQQPMCRLRDGSALNENLDVFKASFTCSRIELRLNEQYSSVSGAFDLAPNLRTPDFGADQIDSIESGFTEACASLSH